MRTFIAPSSARRLLLPLLLLALPSVAQAHVGVGDSGGVLPGLAHPLTGLDHVCAMLAVGLFAGQRGGRALWLLPLAFMLVMTLGGILGMAAVSLPLVEPGLAASVLVLGILVAGAVRLPLAASALVVAFFALLHGHAHGAELPHAASGVAYGAGFLLATAGLLLGGVGLAVGLQRTGTAPLVRAAGAAIAACGVCLCLA